VGWYGVDGIGVAVGKDVDLGVGMEFFKGFLLVLVALDVEDINGYRKSSNDGSYSLEDVVVSVEKVEGGGELIDSAVDIQNDCFVVHGDGERWGGASVGVGIRVSVEKVMDPRQASKQCRSFGSFRVMVRVLSSWG